jgi:intracellular sulfur oxidation DsrE/DsrF family protein
MPVTTAWSVKRMKRAAVALVFGGVSMIVSGDAMARDAAYPVIAGYGQIMPAEGVANMPDPSVRYRVVFDVQRAATDEAQVHPAFERAARFVNLLGRSGIRPMADDIVVIVYGAATTAILSDEAYQARFHRANPNTLLLAELKRAGVAVHVCSYALAHAKVERKDVSHDVEVDLAAMVTLVTLQAKGWSVISG